MTRKKPNSKRTIGLQMKTNGTTMKTYGTTMKAKAVSLKALETVISHYKLEAVDGEYQLTAEMLQHAMALDEQWKTGMGKPAEEGKSDGNTDDPL